MTSSSGNGGSAAYGKTELLSNLPSFHHDNFANVGSRTDKGDRSQTTVRLSPFTSYSGKGVTPERLG